VTPRVSQPREANRSTAHAFLNAAGPTRLLGVSAGCVKNDDTSSNKGSESETSAHGLIGDASRSRQDRGEIVSGAKGARHGTVDAARKLQAVCCFRKASGRSGEGCCRQSVARCKCGLAAILREGSEDGRAKHGSVSSRSTTGYRSEFRS